MGVFHVFKIKQMVPNRATHHILVLCYTWVTCCSLRDSTGYLILTFMRKLTLISFMKAIKVVNEI